jgi:2-desacetyl-2-hydroxyethyl bacteriochlorophyllide A dehydrogenase
MKTVLCEQPGSLALVQRPEPVAGPDEVRLRVRSVGICGTDIHIFGGTQPYLSYPRVMGHELSGEVLSAPAGSGLVPGDVAYVMPYLSCGECIACRRGKTNCCTRIQVLGVHCDGALVEFLCVPQRFVRKVEGIGFDEAAMIEFLAIGAHTVRRARGQGELRGRRALVVGAGPIGLAVALFAQLHGAEVTMLDTREDRLAFARQHLRVAHTLAVGEGDRETLSALTGGEFFDAVFDATGNARAMERGLQFVAHGGCYVWVSIVADAIALPDPEFHKRETTLLASRNATIDDFEEVVAAMRAGQVPTRALNTHRATLDALPEVFATWTQPQAGVVKAIVQVA